MRPNTNYGLGYNAKSGIEIELGGGPQDINKEGIKSKSTIVREGGYLPPPSASKTRCSASALLKTGLVRTSAQEITPICFFTEMNAAPTS